MWLGSRQLLHWELSLELLHLRLEAALCYECIDAFTYLLPDCFLILRPFVVIHIVKLVLVLVFSDGNGGFFGKFSSLISRPLECCAMLKGALRMPLFSAQERRLPQLVVKLLIPEAPELL